MWHIVTTVWFSVCVFCWLMTCALSIFSVLDNFCQISPLHSNAVWMTRVLYLICNAHTHILLFCSKFHIILAMYVQMLEMYNEKIEKYWKSRICSIFSKISGYFPTLFCADKRLYHTVRPVTWQECFPWTTSTASLPPSYHSTAPVWTHIITHISRTLYSWRRHRQRNATMHNTCVVVRLDGNNWCNSFAKKLRVKQRCWWLKNITQLKGN